MNLIPRVPLLVKERGEEIKLIGNTRDFVNTRFPDYFTKIKRILSHTLVGHIPDYHLRTRD